MKMLLLMLLFPLSITLPGQNNFSKQLNQIIKGSANHFSKFRGDFKAMHLGDSAFYSTITIEGTRENDIVITQMLTQYRCEIMGPVNERKGKVIVDQWYEKLIGVLGSRFKPEKAKTVSWSPVKYGWSFKNGETWVDISLVPVSLDSPRYYVSLAVTCFSSDFYNVK